LHGMALAPHSGDRRVGQRPSTWRDGRCGSRPPPPPPSPYRRHGSPVVSTVGWHLRPRRLRTGYLRHPQDAGFKVAIVSVPVLSGRLGTGPRASRRSPAGGSCAWTSETQWSQRRRGTKAICCRRQHSDPCDGDRRVEQVVVVASASLAACLSASARRAGREAGRSSRRHDPHRLTRTPTRNGRLGWPRPPLFLLGPGRPTGQRLRFSFRG